MLERANQVLGWQGVTIDAPADWSITGFGGDNRSGNLRVDASNLEARSAPVGIEVRWIDYKKPATMPQLESRLAELLKSVQKAARKRNETAETWSAAVNSGHASDRPAQIAFRWKASSAGSGRIWYCATCGRVVLAQVYGKGGQRFLDQAAAILDSIGCHGDEVGWRTWGLYGLSTAAPANYTLSSQQVMNIYLQLLFRLDRTEDTLTIEQWSLANVQLKDAYLDEWFEAKAGSSLAHVRYEKREDDVHGHQALALSGRRGGLFYWLGDALRSLLRFRAPATYYDALLWECAESNKTYLIQTFSRAPQAQLLRDIAARTRCHAE